jgi:ssDNA-binding replication factor A large subunit
LSYLAREDVEKIKKLIFEKRPEITETELRELIEEKKRELGFPLSDTTALLLVANDLGIRLKPEPKTTKLSKLEPGLPDVTVMGRLVWLGDPREFTPRERRGVVMRGELGDDTATVPIIFWNEKVNELEALGIREGDVVRIEHAYTRASLSGHVELHVGVRAVIERLENVSGIPPAEDFYIELKDLKPEMARVNTYGIVLDDPITRSFVREDGTPSSFMTFRLGYENASCRVVIWGPYASELQWLRKGHSIVVNGARVRLGRDGLELHLGLSSRLRRLERAVPVKIETVKLAEVPRVKGVFKVYVKVLAIGETGKDREGNPYVSMLVADETGYATVTLLRGAWRQARGVSPGDVIGLVNPSVRIRVGMVFLLVTAADNIDIPPTPEPIMPIISVPKVKVAEITPAHHFVTVEGVVADNPVIITSPSGDVVSGTVMMVDETSPCNVTFGPAHASMMQELRKGDRIRIEAAQVLIGTDFPPTLRLRSFSRVVIL